MSVKTSSSVEYCKHRLAKYCSPRAVIAFALAFLAAWATEFVFIAELGIFIYPAVGILLATIRTVGFRFASLAWVISSVVVLNLNHQESYLTALLWFVLEPLLISALIYFGYQRLDLLKTGFVNLKSVAIKLLLVITITMLVSLLVSTPLFALESDITDAFLSEFWITFVANFAGLVVGFPLAQALLAGHSTYPFKLVILTVSIGGGYLLTNTMKQNYQLLVSQDQVSLALAGLEMEAMLQGYFSELEIYQRSVANLFANNINTSEREFAEYVKSFADIKLDFVVTEWLPKIKLADRQRYEAAMAKKLNKSFHISDLSADGTHKPALRRHEYFPVTYVYPQWNNKDSYGFDPRSARFSNEAILESIETRKAVFRKPLQMNLQNGKSLPVMVSYEGVFDKAQPEKLLGLILIALKPQRVFDQAALHIYLKDFDFTLQDIKSGENFYSTGGASSGAEILSRPVKALGRELMLLITSKNTLFGPVQKINQANDLLYKTCLLLMIFGYLWLIDNAKERFRQALEMRTSDLKRNVKKAKQSARQAQQLLQKKIQAEKQLRLSNIAFEYASEAMLVMAYKTGLVVISNERFHNLTGIVRDEALNMADLLNVIDDGKGQSQIIQEQIMHNHYWRGELSITPSIQQVTPVLASISLVNDVEDYLIVIFSEITELKRTQEALLWRANYDKLTNLPNRALFYDRIEEQVKLSNREQKSLCMLFIDLDKFKYINDTMGHKMGDAYLKHVAQQLRAVVRETDTVARLGGDEFTILLSGIERDGNVDLVISKIIAAIRTPIILDGKTLVPDASIGVAYYPSDATCADDLINFADRAMYAAKESKTRTYVIYNDDIAQRWETNEKLNQEIHSALTNKKIDIFFQPFNDSFSESEHIAYEVLLRWHHPDNGIVSAAEFMSSLVDINLIIALDCRALELVIDYLKRLNQSAVYLRCSINISIHSLLSEGFVSLVKQNRHLLSEQNDLFIELKEKSLNHMSEEVIRGIENVKALGVKIILDDFGCSNVGLTLLQKLPVDIVKIDQSLSGHSAHDHRSEMVVRSIVGICMNFNMVPVVQFVESEQEIQWFTSLGVKCFQGYALSQPMSFDELEALLVT